MKNGTIVRSTVNGFLAVVKQVNKGEGTALVDWMTGPGGQTTQPLAELVEDQGRVTPIRDGLTTEEQLDKLFQQD